MPYSISMLIDSSRRSAAEVDELFERKVKPWKFSKTRTAKQLSNEQELVKAEKASG